MPRNLAFSLLFMRPIAKGFIFRKAAPTELWIFNGAGDIAICVDEIDSSSNANRSALRIYKYLYILRHNQLLVEVIAKRLRTRWVAKLGHRL